jgi:hypothetical protein
MVLKTAAMAALAGKMMKLFGLADGFRLWKQWGINFGVAL